MRRLICALFALAILLASAPLHADSYGVRSGWGEDVEVRVLDGRDRPLPGAAVNVTWPINSYRLGNTATLLTDERGRAYFHIDTYETNPDKQNYTFTVRGSYAGLKREATFDHNRSLGPRTLWFPVFEVGFVVRDQDGNPLAATLRSEGQNATCDANGWAELRLTSGSHDVHVLYGGAERIQTLSVKNDSLSNVTLRLYTLRLHLIDDSGAPLQAQVSADSEIYATDSKGDVRLYNLTTTPLPLTIYYGTHKKDLSINLALFNQTVVVFDSHPPVIENLQGVYNGTTLRVSATVNDPGDYGAGLSERQAAITVQYTLPGETKPKTVPMYAIGYNRFEAAIPLMAGSGDVRYTIIASDSDGNTAQSSDIFNFAIAKPDDKPQTSLPTSVKTPDPIAQYGWVLLLLLLVLIGGGYWYYTSRRAPSGLSGGSGEYKFQEGGDSAPGIKLPFNRPKPKPPQTPPTMKVGEKSS